MLVFIQLHVHPSYWGNGIHIVGERTNNSAAFPVRAGPDDEGGLVRENDILSGDVV